jgi:hypothetical protein
MNREKRKNDFMERAVGEGNRRRKPITHSSFKPDTAQHEQQSLKEE